MKTPYQIPPRELMPEISAAAHKTLSIRPGYNKQFLAEQNHQPIKGTCSVCNQPYNKTFAELQILSYENLNLRAKIH